MKGTVVSDRHMMEFQQHFPGFLRLMKLALLDPKLRLVCCTQCGRTWVHPGGDDFTEPWHWWCCPAGCNTKARWGIPQAGQTVSPPPKPVTPPWVRGRIAGMCQITIDVPDTALGDERSQQAVATEVKMAVAVRLYMTGRLNLLQAATMVGIPQIEFRQRMGEFGDTEFALARSEVEGALAGV